MRLEHHLVGGYVRYISPYIIIIIINARTYYVSTYKQDSDENCWLATPRHKHIHYLTEITSSHHILYKNNVPMLSHLQG